MFVGDLPGAAILPAACGKSVALASLNLGAKDGIYGQSNFLEPNTTYVLSAYIWNFGDKSRHALANVDLNDAPGEVNLNLRYDDDRAALGRFIYQRFDTAQTGKKLWLRLFFDENSAPAEEPSGARDIAWDHVAITKAARFVPPRLRELKPESANP
jgi:hypothetical protein